MKKFFLILSLIIFSSAGVFADTDYEQIYRELEPADFSYVHNVDPGEIYDVQGTSWSPYPLFRLTAPLYFKNTTIEPGYYLLTPREHKGNWYVLFKEQGQVKYIIPAYDKEIVPMDFYDANLPKTKLTPMQNINLKFHTFIGEHVKSSQRKPAPNTYLEATDLENNFISLVIYWGNYRYYLILRSIQL
jgi:hypothetical protein